MSWFFIDDQFPMNRKLAVLPPAKKLACVGLWALSGAWCRGHNPTGEIPLSMVTTLGGTRALADLLVQCGLWERTASGFAFHNWGDWQHVETAEEADKRRAQTRERVRRFRVAEKLRKAVASNADVTRYGNAGNGHVLGEGEGEGYVGGSREGGGSGSESLDSLEAAAIAAEGCGQ